VVEETDVSHVTNVILSVLSDDKPRVDEFSKWLEEECPLSDPRVARTGCGSLNRISGPDHNWGGYKNPECDVYAGTLNGADLGAVVVQFGSVRWRFPENTQLFLMDQDQSHFRVWMISEGRPVQYAPTKDVTLRDRFPE
jgi:hypothetical protein